MQLKVIRKGSKGILVQRWQNFLIGQGHAPGVADGDFGEKSHKATIEFQKKVGVTADGVVGNETWGKAIGLGFPAISDDGASEDGPEFPPKPNFKPLVGTQARQAVFGKFPFTQKPVPGNKENIDILGDWEQKNIETIVLPQLKGVKVGSATSSGSIRFHKLAIPQLRALWEEWEVAGLLDRVLTYDGAFVPRFIRGSTTTLSNHAFGSAFDINAEFNGLGVVPALKGRKGSVRELVQIANKHGFYWGGHFDNRKDGMHFEIAKIV